jgi:hypothetical protein
MSEQEKDSTGSTQMFQAFVERDEPERSRSRTPNVALLAAVVAGLAVAAVLAWTTLGA